MICLFNEITFILLCVTAIIHNFFDLLIIINQRKIKEHDENMKYYDGLLNHMNHHKNLN
jgi:hypothetical protein